MKKLLTIAIVCALLAACGSTAEAPDPLARSAAAGGVALPEPAEAIPAFVVAVRRPLDEAVIARIGRTEGVAVVTPVALERMAVTGPDGAHRLLVGAVDALDYRPLAPRSTRDAEFVWEALLAGGSVPTFEAAGALGVEGGGEIRLARTRSLQVGALAANGAPSLVDVLVDTTALGRLSFDDGQLVVVGAAPGASRGQLSAALARRTGLEERLVPLLPDALADGPSAALPEGEAGGLIGTMTFKVLEDGFIKPDRRWVDRNIDTAIVPILGEVACHRLMVPQLAGALGEIESLGLAAAIDPSQYGGCYVPRFVDRDSSQPLSMHAFGLAVDLNVSTNQLGTTGSMDERVVDVFERWGFAWGGGWERPDPMHFELARLKDF